MPRLCARGEEEAASLWSRVQGGVAAVVPGVPQPSQRPLGPTSAAAVPACASLTRQLAVNELIVGVIIYRGGVGISVAGGCSLRPWSAAVFVVSQRVC